MLPYSQKFIDSVDINKYLNESDIKELLDERVNNFKDLSFMVDYTRMLSLTGIDHYICKMIFKNEQVNSIIKTYLEKVEEQLTNNPFLYYSLPISKLSPNQLRPYIPNIDKIIAYLKNKGNCVYNIYLKFENDPYSLNREEKNQLIEYFYYRVGTDAKGVKVAQDEFIKFLLNNADGLGYQSLSLIIKYFGYQKCQEDNLYDTQIIIADTTKKGENVLGISTKKAVILSKKNINKTTFKNNKLQNNYGQTPHYVEGLAYLLTLFHELRHQKQRYECDNNMETSISYYLGAHQIIHSLNPDDYNDNYMFSEIEKDANYFGWIEVEKIIKNYIPGESLKEAVHNIQRHKYTELIEDLCAGRKKGEKKELAKYALCKYLDEAIRKKPTIVSQEYKQFKLFYEDTGEPKKLLDLLKLPIDKDCENFYFEQIIYRTTNDILTNDFANMSYHQKISIIKQISNIINLIYVKLKVIADYKESSFNISLINNNESLLIGDNIKYYKNAARNLTRLIQVSLFLYSDLSNLDIDLNKIINEINEDLKRINKIKVCNQYDNNAIHLLTILGGIKYGYRR